jgi:hypothetical protein
MKTYVAIFLGFFIDTRVAREFFPMFAGGFMNFWRIVSQGFIDRK